MNEAWQILQLDPATATEKDIKAAYARLLKLHRPDQDPEGFRRVRWAYEWVLAWLKHEALPASAVATEVHPLFTIFREALEQHDLPALVEALHQWRHEPATANGGRGGDDGILQGLIRLHLPWLASAVDDAQMTGWLEEGHAQICRDIFEEWEGAEQTERMLRFLDFVSQKADRIEDPECISFLYDLAVWAAFWSRPLASDLGNQIFKRLSLEGREGLIETLEGWIALGEHFYALTPETRQFWWMHLRRANRPWDWESEETQRALDEVAEQIDRYCEPIENWRSQIPPEAWQKFEDATERIRLRGSDAGLLKRDSFWFRSMWHGILGALIVFLAIALMGCGFEWIHAQLEAFFESQRHR